jgi:hypothetical protein
VVSSGVQAAHHDEAAVLGLDGDTGIRSCCQGSVWDMNDRHLLVQSSFDALAAEARPVADCLLSDCQVEAADGSFTIFGQVFCDVAIVGDPVDRSHDLSCLSVGV